MLSGDREKFEVFKVPKAAHYALVSSIDGLSLLRRDLSSVADAADLKRPFFDGAHGGTVPDLPSHGIFDRGRLVGLWEYDPAEESIAWTSFIPKNKDLEKAVARTEDMSGPNWAMRGRSAWIVRRAASPALKRYEKQRRAEARCQTH